MGIINEKPPRMLSLSVAVLEIRRGCEVGGKHVAATVVEAHIVDVDPSRACRATELRGRGRRRSARSCGGSVRADIPPPPRSRTRPPRESRGDGHLVPDCGGSP